MTIKKILIIFIFSIANFLFSQAETTNLNINCSSKIIVPLRTFTETPENQCYYLKDTNNELPDYEGTWKGTWNNKSLYITFKKISNKFDNHFKYNKDLLIGKFEVIDSNGEILFDNTSVSDDNAKIKGGKFVKDKNDYSFSYYDKDLCGTRGYITIKFTDATKTQLQWKYIPRRVTIFTDCFFYNYPMSQYPEPLPKNLILIKQ